MTVKINPLNKTAQLHYRSAGNPASSLPTSAISNCFPGLEFDFKNFWRRAFVGIVLQEWDNYVTEVEEEKYSHLLHHRLLRIGGRDLVTTVVGPRAPGRGPVTLPSGDSPGVVAFEWSNALAFALQYQGSEITCLFTADAADVPLLVPEDPARTIEVQLTVRHFFAGDSVSPSEDLLQPGELTQGLCSPWQHDYRECACYYWPASRPDYVNVEPTIDGVSRGDSWISKPDNRPGQYILDDREDSRLVTYDELFLDWEKMLKFAIKGRDGDRS